MKNRVLLLIITFGFSFSNIQAQDTIKAKDSIQDTYVETPERVLYLIKKTDGNEIFGYIISDDGREILLETKSIGNVYISKADIKEMVVVENKDNKELAYGEYRNAGPYTTRYYFTTNALPIKKREDYAMINLYGPEVHFAVTDNFSLGVMATWIASPIALAAKYSFDSKSKTHFALGGIFGSSGYLYQGQAFGGLYFATLTQGDRKSNVSLSAGYGHVNMGGNNISYQPPIGPKYCFGNNYSNSTCGSQYTITNPSAQQAVSQEVYDSYYNSSFDLYQKKSNDALALGVAGITPVGKKASFIFDAMAFIRSRERQDVEYHDYDVTVTYDDYYDANDNYTGTAVSRTGTFTIGEGELVNSGTKEYATTIILMPSMRFNASYNKAFQVALAGVINVGFNKRVTSFPVPMVSWLRSF